MFSLTAQFDNILNFYLFFFFVICFMCCLAFFASLPFCLNFLILSFTFLTSKDSYS